MTDSEREAFNERIAIILEPNKDALLVPCYATAQSIANKQIQEMQRKAEYELQGRKNKVS